MRHLLVIALLVIAGFGCAKKPPAKQFQGPADYVSPNTAPPK